MLIEKVKEMRIKNDYILHPTDEELSRYNNSIGEVIIRGKIFYKKEELFEKLDKIADEMRKGEY